jgi:hypothetical protein
MEDGITALVAKRDLLKTEVKRLRADIKVLDLAIGVMRDGATVTVKKAPPAGIRVFGRKDILNATLKALRTNPDGMTVPTVADAAMLGKSIDRDDLNLRRVIEHRVANTMTALKNKGMLADCGEDASGRKIYRIT